MQTPIPRDAIPLPSTSSESPALNRTILPPRTSENLADDVVRGADAIAELLFGAKDQRRKIYHLAETSRLPVFRLGSVLCVRRSVLLAWIADQERRNAQAPRQP